MIRRSFRAAYPQRRAISAFSLAELLVVVGVLALLLAITVPPLQLARKHAMRTQCTAQLQQIGRGLGNVHTETGFYPLPDDGGAPIRYTWIDVLLEQRLIGGEGGRIRAGNGADNAGRDNSQIGYCPEDPKPDVLNAARHGNLIYPLTRTQGGIDYSYGIGIPLASGGWALRTSAGASPETRSRRFRDADRDQARRVLAADAYTSGIYNLSGNALLSGIWNDPTQFDNTVAWGRHSSTPTTGAFANVLYQDLHVAVARYAPSAPQPINTAATFVWRSGESIYTNPADGTDDALYPNQSPPSYMSTPRGQTFPNELVPLWYTQMLQWTQIAHK